MISNLSAQQSNEISGETIPVPKDPFEFILDAFDHYSMVA